jgi:hypothetical protein
MAKVCASWPDQELSITVGVDLGRQSVLRYPEDTRQIGSYTNFRSPVVVMTCFQGPELVTLGEGLSKPFDGA